MGPQKVYFPLKFNGLWNFHAIFALSLAKSAPPLQERALRRDGRVA